MGRIDARTSGALGCGATLLCATLRAERIGVTPQRRNLAKRRGTGGWMCISFQTPENQGDSRLGDESHILPQDRSGFAGLSGCGVTPSSESPPHACGSARREWEHGARERSGVRYEHAPRCCLSSRARSRTGRLCRAERGSRWRDGRHCAVRRRAARDRCGRVRERMRRRRRWLRRLRGPRLLRRRRVRTDHDVWTRRWSPLRCELRRDGRGDVHQRPGRRLRRIHRLRRLQLLQLRELRVGHAVRSAPGRRSATTRACMRRRRHARDDARCLLRRLRRRRERLRRLR